MGANLQNGELFLMLNGIRHWVRIAGAEHGTTPLLILHGGPGGNVYTFERTIGPKLEEFQTVIYFEQRGCGRSEQPPHPTDYSFPLLLDDLEQLRNGLGIEQWIPLGFSFGGQLAMEYTLAHPHAVERLILQCAAPGDAARIAAVQMFGFEFVAADEDKPLFRQIIAQDGPLIGRDNRCWNLVDQQTADRFLFFNQEAAKLNRQLWSESNLMNTGDMAKALWEHPVEPPLLYRVQNIQAPTLVLCGLHDRNTGVEASRDLAFRIPHGTLVIFEHSAHFPDLEESDKYAATVKQFLGK